MIFLGDVAHPFAEPPCWQCMALPWQPQPAVVNLEGPLNDDMRVLAERKLFNHSSILPALVDVGVTAAVLANNHVLDLPDRLQATTDTLNANGIATVGAEADTAAAARSIGVEENGREIRLLAFGWHVIGCGPASSGRPGVNPMTAEHVVASIKAERAAHPASGIVANMHWNYELEAAPQPAHRRLAHMAIEAGADAVVGHHPHRPGGIEFYRGKLIAWSLGNFWLPQGVFFGGTLRYPPEAQLQLALEWSPDRQPVCHWFGYEPVDHGLRHLGSCEAEDDSRVAAMVPWGTEGQGNRGYEAWFARNRVKRKLLPIYRVPEATLGNAVRDRWIGVRHVGVMIVKAAGGPVMRKLRKGVALATEMVRQPVHTFRWLGERVKGTQPISKGLPWLSWKCVDYLEAHVRPGMRVFEFGGGGSTLFFARRGCEVVTVETDEGWIELLKSELAKLPDGGQTVRLIHAVRDESDAALKEHYCGLVEDGAPWDIVLVDGWEDLRPECARRAREAVKSDGIVIVDNTDFPNIAAAVDEMRGMVLRRFIGMGTGRRTLGQTDVFSRA